LDDPPERTIRLQVHSEIGRLRHVLLHAPGREVDRMVPAMMEELLFDDILFGEAAREEHRIFRRLLEALDVEVVEARDLLIEALDGAGAREWLLGAMLEGLSPRLRTRWQEAAAADLADVLVHGVRRDPGTGGIAGDELFELPPLPNWCFQRDPQVVVGDGIVFAPMATATRWCETLLSHVIFGFHRRLRDARVILDPLHVEPGRPLSLGLDRPRFEGGDVLVLSADVIVVGLSQRTNRTGMRKLARALAGYAGGPRWMEVVDLPRRRAYMHLDTVFTPVDRNACLVHPPVISTAGAETAAVYEIDLAAAEPSPRPVGDLLSALRRRGIDLRTIPCGGQDPIHQQREQWTDGANALGLAPGVIVLYDRNVRTAEALDHEGFEIVPAAAILSGSAAVDLDAARRVCVLLPSHEISRARGGPHCLTHALRRDPLPRD
jgi:arginine deiminase